MDRKKQVLKAIIRQFIDTAEPVGSKAIIVRYNFKISPATIRNDMASLEKQGLIYQPHTSAGRIPTSLGYRQFVDDLADKVAARKKARQILETTMQEYKKEKIREKVYDAVTLLSKATNNVSFATLPDNTRTFYLGLANVLKQPEFTKNPFQASQVIEVLENNDNFISLLHHLELEDQTRVFIGEENILENIKSCSLIVSPYKIHDYTGFLGILGPTRMDYALNTALVDEVSGLLNISS